MMVHGVERSMHLFGLKFNFDINNDQFQEEKKSDIFVGKSFPVFEVLHFIFGVDQCY